MDEDVGHERWKLQNCVGNLTTPAVRSPAGAGTGETCEQSDPESKEVISGHSVR